MPDRPTPHSSFTVTSGCVCFGDLHNIWNGTSAPVQQFRDRPPDPVASGTVRTQPIEYNTAAKNGEWLVFELTAAETTAWFVAHEDVDPNTEVRKILRVSGLPGDIDSGSSYNDAITARNGVLVLNRYGWGHYDKRSADEVGLAEDLGDSDDLNFVVDVGAGIVDRCEAKDAVSQWKDKPSAEREPIEHGVWLDIPHGEFMYGRFGYDDEHTEARSFLFFNTYTQFTETTFAGSAQTLLRKETPKERMERQLREGFDFSGIEWLSMARQRAGFPPPPPPPQVLLGPYDPGEHILTAEDVDVTMHSPKIVRTFEPQYGGSLELPEYRGELDEEVKPLFEPWWQSLCNLLNEMVMSHLERVVAPNMSNRGFSDAAEALYPSGPQNKRAPLEKICHAYFKHERSPDLDFDMARIGERIKAFLTRVGGPSATYEDECIAGIARVVAYLVVETMELANSSRWNHQRFRIVPQDVRIAVFNDAEVVDYFEFSRVYWEGRSEA